MECSALRRENAFYQIVLYSMATQSQFLKLLQDIEPSETTKSNAIKAHHNLRDFLKTHEDFKPFLIKTFLSGSYKRDTAIRPRTKNGNADRPDIDIIVLATYTLEDKPADVINFLYKVLKQKYSNIRKQSRSVGIETTLADMDVVLIVAPDGEDGTLHIPDRKLDEWIETNPPKHTQWTTDINDESNGTFKPLVKLTKWWRRENRTVSKRPKGFVVECIVAECMDYDEQNYEELFLLTFEEIVKRYADNIDSEELPWIEDPGVPGQSVTAGMSFAAFEGFYNKVKEHAEIGRQAQDEEDPAEELKLWRKIFGERFPASSSTTSRSSYLREPIIVNPLSFPDRPVTPGRTPRGFA